MKSFKKYLKPRIILIILLLLSIILVYIFYFRKNENFMVTTDQFNLNSDCPDYLIYNGDKFFLVNNKNPDRPESFNTLDEAHNRLKQYGCPEFKPIYLTKNKLSNDYFDPTVSFNRLCNKKIAEGNFVYQMANYEITDNNNNIKNINNNINNFENNINENENNSQESDKVKVASWSESSSIKKYYDMIYNFLDKSIKSEDTKNKLGNLEKYKDNNNIQNMLNNFIKYAEPYELENYNHEICMINQMSKTMDIGNFNDLFNSVNYTGKITNNNIPEINYGNLEKHSNSITNEMMNKIFKV